MYNEHFMTKVYDISSIYQKTSYQSLIVFFQGHNSNVFTTIKVKKKTFSRLKIQKLPNCILYFHLNGLLCEVTTGTRRDSSVKLSYEITFLRWKSHSIEFLISKFGFSRQKRARKFKFTNKKFNGMGFPSQKGNFIWKFYWRISSRGGFLALKYRQQ